MTAEPRDERGCLVVLDNIRASIIADIQRDRRPWTPAELLERCGESGPWATLGVVCEILRRLGDDGVVDVISAGDDEVLSVWWRS